MARSKENLAFADRLKQALARSPKRIETPSELALQFNLHHQGAQITNQAAQKWLTGLNKPTLEKIETLADMCRVSAQWLLYGTPEKRSAAKHLLQKSNNTAPTPSEVKLLVGFRQLSDFQQELIVSLVEQMALNQNLWCDTHSREKD